MGEKRGLQALQAWCRKVTEGYPNVRVSDMSMSWKDGLAFCAIIHHFRPDLIDFGSLTKEDILLNNQLAFTVAEQTLGIPALLDAEDMLKYAEPDKLSIATYVSQFYQYFERSAKNSPSKISLKRPFAERPCNFSPQAVPVAKVTKNYAFRQTTKQTFNRAAPRGFMRDDKCSACQQRVFLLERLIVDCKLYHRTCFICSKCKIILKPGAYAAGDETGTYECVVCPKEEEEEEEVQRKLTVSRKSDGVQETHSLSVDKVTESPTKQSPQMEMKLSNSFLLARKKFCEKSLSDTGDEMESFSIENKVVPDKKTSDLTLGNENSCLDNLKNNQEVKQHSLVTKTKLSMGDSEIGTDRFQDDLSRSKEQRVLSTPVEPKSPKLTGVADKYRTDDSAEVVSPPIKTPRKSRQSLGKLEIKQLNSDGTFTDSHLSPSSDPIKSPSVNIPVIKSPSYSLPLIKTLPPTPPNFDTIPLKTMLSGSKAEKSSWESRVELRKKNDFGKSQEAESPRTSPKISDIRKSFETFRKLDSLSNKEQKKSATSPTSITSPTSLTSPTKFSYNKQLLRKQNDNKSLNIEDLDLCKNPPEEQSKEPTSNSELLLTESTPNYVDTDLGQLKHEFAAKEGKKLNISRKENKGETQSNPIIESTVYKQNVETGNDFENESKINFISEKESISSVTDVATDSLKIDTPKPKSTLSKKSVLSSNIELPEKSLQAPTEKPDAIIISETLKPTPKSLEKPEPESELPGELYPDELNPFDIEEEGTEISESYPDDLNPFGDSDTEANITPIFAKETCPPESNRSRGQSYDDSLNPFGDSETEGNADVCSSDTWSGKYSMEPSPDASLTSTPKATRMKKRLAPLPPGGDLRTPDRLVSPCSSKPTSPRPAKKKAPKPPPASPTNVDSKAMKEQNNLSMVQKQKDQVPALNTFGYWKKKKRPAPSVPVPPRRHVVKIPVKEIQSELVEIEDKQEELESQGRELEMMIRDHSQEDEPAEGETPVDDEDLILQLFELVNQKNVLFRRQAELMYIKRSQRLEEEQAELEYEIRCLMCKPEKHKTEEDVKKEDNLLQKLLEVVELRNEIVESMDLDRQRVQDEDLSIQEQFSQRRSSLQAQSQENLTSEEISKKKKKSTLKHKFKREKDKSKDKTKESSDSLWKFTKKDKKKQ